MPLAKPVAHPVRRFSYFPDRSTWTADFVTLVSLNGSEDFHLWNPKFGAGTYATGFLGLPTLGVSVMVSSPAWLSNNSDVSGMLRDKTCPPDATQERIRITAPVSGNGVGYTVRTPSPTAGPLDFFEVEIAYKDLTQGWPFTPESWCKFAENTRQAQYKCGDLIYTDEICTATWRETSRDEVRPENMYLADVCSMDARVAWMWYRGNVEKQGDNVVMLLQRQVITRTNAAGNRTRAERVWFQRFRQPRMIPNIAYGKGYADPSGDYSVALNNMLGEYTDWVADVAANTATQMWSFDGVASGASRAQAAGRAGLLGVVLAMAALAFAW